MLNNILTETEMSLDASIIILIAVGVIVAVLGAIFFLYRGVRKERNRYAAEKLKIGVMDKEKFDELIMRRVKIAKRSSKFSVVFLGILNDKELFNSLGKKQYEAMIGTVSERLYTVMPVGTKICEYEQGIIAAFIDQDMDKKGISDMVGFCITECKKPVELITRVVVTVSASMGAATFDYDSDKNSEQFLANAMRALKSAEKLGAYKYCVYSPEIDYSEEEQFRFYRDMKRSPDDNQYIFMYSEIKAGEDNSLGYIVKPYWNSKENGTIEREKFLPALFQSGKIAGVSQNLFTALAKRISELDGGKDKIFYYYLSDREINDNAVSAGIYKALSKYRAATGRICVVAEDFENENILLNLKKYKDFGFKIGVKINEKNASDIMMQAERIKFDAVLLPAEIVSGSKEKYFYKGITEMFVSYANRNGVKTIATDIACKEEQEDAESFGITELSGAFIEPEKEI